MKPAQKPEKSQIYVINPNPTVNSVVVIAPHAWNKTEGKDYGDKDYDILTGEIAQTVAERIGCKALINWDWKKETEPGKRNYNFRPDAERDKKFIADLREIGKTGAVVLWIHGAANEAIEKEKKIYNAKNSDAGLQDLHAVLGYGQGKNGDNLTAKTETATKFIGLLQQQGLSTISASPTPGKGRKTKCANKPENMCQWFRQNGYSLDQVQSIQIEIKKSGFRDKHNYGQTADILSKALEELLGIPAKEFPEQKHNAVEEAKADEKLVKRAYDTLAEIIVRHYGKAMYEVGEYLIKEFYANDYRRVYENKPAKKQSLNQLYQMLSENYQTTPSRAWFYNAVNMVADERYFDEIGFSIYRNEKLRRSHKVFLTYVRDTETKKNLAEETVNKGYTVAQLRERIAQEKDEKQKEKIPIDQLPPKKELLGFDIRLLRNSGQQAKQQVGYHKKKMELYKQAEKKLQSAIQDKEATIGNNPDPEKYSFGFKDWTVENVNFCNGCANDCVYCYAKEQAYRRNQIEIGQWHKQIIRQKDVDAPRKLYRGRVGFPSTHDINEHNIDAYLTVLGKLLRAGNEVLIVSKPRLECVKRICSASEFFKNEITFRFTIGAMNDDILKLWEPNAPGYEERKQALKYAYEQGFQTSVSVEPMLDSLNIDDLINDLSPFVNDAIWLGTMNHVGRIEKYADENIKKALETIKINQADGRLKEIYNRHKNNDKIKWKHSIKKVVGLKPAPAPGMDE